MHEDDIKAEVLSWVRRACRGRQLPVVTSEFSLNGTGIRADLAILDRSFYGIEVKSAADTLKRLPSQMAGYARYFDRTVLVVDVRHLRNLKEVDLRGAQVWSRSALAEQKMRSRGTRAPVSGHTLLGLLTMEEERRAIRSMAERGLQADTDCARLEFERAFRRRYSATSEAFWSKVAGRKIYRDDIAQLSRFLPERERRRTVHAQQETAWNEWAARLSSELSL